MKKPYDISKYKIKLNKSVSEDIRLVFLSDLHSKEYGEANDILIEDIKALKPDVILCAGDMIVSEAPELHDVSVSLFKELCSICSDVYFANGNHESRIRRNTERYGSAYLKYTEALSNAGVKLLNNEHEEIVIKGSKLCIFGLELEYSLYKRFKYPKMDEGYMEETLGRVNEENINILLAHNPDYAKKYAEWGADLAFSGHLHGGVVGLPFKRGAISPQYHLFPKYCNGVYRVGNMYEIVSRGLGSHSMPIRINDRPHLVVVRLVNGE